MFDFVPARKRGAQIFHEDRQSVGGDNNSNNKQQQKERKVTDFQTLFVSLLLSPSFGWTAIVEQ